MTKIIVFFLILTLALSIIAIEPFNGYKNVAFAEGTFFHVTLYSNGEVYTPRTQIAGATCPIPDFDSSRAPLGKDFSHWSTSIDGESFDFSTDVSYQDLVLYAVFKDKTYTISIYKNGEVTNTFSFTHGTSVNKNDLSSNGTFYTDSACTLIKEFPFTITEDTALFTRVLTELPVKPLPVLPLKPALKPIKPPVVTPPTNDTEVENNIGSDEESSVSNNDINIENQENEQPNEVVWLPYIGISLSFVCAILLFLFTCFLPKRQARK